MQTIVKWIAILGIGAASLFALGGYWLTENADVVADAAVEASGIKDRVAEVKQRECDEARRVFETAWNRAVDDNKIDQREEQLARAEARMNDYCAGVAGQ